MLLIGLAFLPLSPPFGILMIVGALAVLPMSRKLDSDVQKADAERKAAGYGKTMDDRAQDGFSLGLIIFALLILFFLVATVAGFNP